MMPSLLDQSEELEENDEHEDISELESSRCSIEGSDCSQDTIGGINPLASEVDDLFCSSWKIGRHCDFRVNRNTAKHRRMPIRDIMNPNPIPAPCLLPLPESLRCCKKDDDESILILGRGDDEGWLDNDG